MRIAQGIVGLLAIVSTMPGFARGGCDPKWAAAPENDQSLAPLRYCYAHAARRYDDSRSDPQAIASRILEACAAETAVMVDHYVARAPVIGPVIGRTREEAGSTLYCHAAGVVTWMRQHPRAPLPAPLHRPKLSSAAGTAPVHVISIGNSTAVQTVNVNAPGAVILLLSFDAPEWRLQWPAGKSPSRILAVGYVATPKVVIPPGSDKVDLTQANMNYVHGPYGLRIDIPPEDGFPYSTKPENLNRLKGYSIAFTGKPPATHQLVYASPGSFTIGP